LGIILFKATKKRGIQAKYGNHCFEDGDFEKENGKARGTTTMLMVVMVCTTFRDCLM
jgi:hypothetical protein